MDTCVWSLSLRRKDPNRLSEEEQRWLAQLREVIQDNRAAIIGPIRQEILSGIRDRAQFAKTESLLEPFLSEETTAADYIEAARLFNLCRDHGIECGPIDIVVCAAAIRLGYEVLTYDRGMLRCIEALRAEGFKL